MTAYLELVTSFFKIGLFGFGGGYAMLPLIQKEIESHNWLTAQQFVDIIAVAESTPGPVAINSATFIGYKVAGFSGALMATIGVCLPSFFIMVILTKVVTRFNDHPIMKGLLYGIRPVVISLILLAAVFIAQTVLISPEGFLGIDWLSVGIAILGFIALQKFKIHPIFLIIFGGITGVILY
jgi:chromate transporter